MVPVATGFLMSATLSVSVSSMRDCSSPREFTALNLRTRATLSEALFSLSDGSSRTSTVASSAWPQPTGAAKYWVSPSTISEMAVSLTSGALSAWVPPLTSVMFPAAKGRTSVLARAALGDSLKASPLSLGMGTAATVMSTVCGASCVRTPR